MVSSASDRVGLGGIGGWQSKGAEVSAGTTEEAKVNAVGQRFEGGLNWGVSRTVSSYFSFFPFCYTLSCRLQV